MDTPCEFQPNQIRVGQVIQYLHIPGRTPETQMTSQFYRN